MSCCQAGRAHPRLGGQHDIGHQSTPQVRGQVSRFYLRKRRASVTLPLRRAAVYRRKHVGTTSSGKSPCPCRRCRGQVANDLVSRKMWGEYLEGQNKRQRNDPPCKDRKMSSAEERMCSSVDCESTAQLPDFGMSVICTHQ